MTMTTVYVQYPNGSVARLETTTDPAEVTLPEGAEQITGEQYDQALAAIQQTNARRRAELDEQLNQEARGDYEALLALNVPESTARRLSGYTPAEESPDVE